MSNDHRRIATRLSNALVLMCPETTHCINCKSIKIVKYPVACSFMDAFACLYECADCHEFFAFVIDFNEQHEPIAIGFSPIDMGAARVFIDEMGKHKAYGVVRDRMKRWRARKQARNN